ncbi:hypothetical protein [Actinoplanes subtropicus]|uniref:dioxygenase family protein n=1 Tax=Actinoplanes subtropicus TaxID=543632 RepID=UPI0006902D12|nr:hypothetical protein [Actinoplanes subtropicus]
MLELGTRHDGGLASDLPVMRRRRMTGLTGAVTVATLGRAASHLTRSGIIRGDIRRGFGTAPGVAHGVRLHIRLRLASANSGRPRAGHAVYLWHADRDGNYSLHAPGLEDENYLRGVQLSDSAGWVRFTSVFPGVHDGHWPRLHFEVYPSLAEAPAARLHAAEITLPADACSAVYATSGYESSRGLEHPGARVEMACVTGDLRRGLVATRTVGI